MLIAPSRFPSLRSGNHELTTRAAQVRNRSAPGIAGPVGIIVGNVRDMHDVLTLGDPVQGQSWPRPGGCPKILRQTMTDALRRDRVETFAVVGVEDSERRLAQPYRLFQDRIKYRRRSPGEALITCSTSAVAVCCSSASAARSAAARSPSRSPPAPRSLPAGQSACRETRPAPGERSR